jgi:hypothetical protein
MANIKKTQITINADKDAGGKEPLLTAGGVVNSSSHFGNQCEVSWLKNKSPLLSHTTCEYISKNFQVILPWRYLYCHVYSSTIENDQIMESA